MRKGKRRDGWLNSESWCSLCPGDLALSEQLERDFLGVVGSCFAF